MAGTVPTGIITLMFTDIQDSTALWERMGDRFRPVLEQHNQLIRAQVQRWDGYEVKSQGDSFMVAFERGTDALQCAVEIQRAMAAQAWPRGLDELRVRIGIHAGEPFLGCDTAGRADYFGPVVNRARRIADAGHGGQILISASTRDLVQGALAGDMQLVDLGRHRLRGLDQPEQLFEVRAPDLPARSFPPLRTLDTFRTNLPSDLTPFVGREQELADLRELLGKAETRLLTLTGPGGSGKTRLAQEVATECAGRFDDGVWWVYLAEVSEPENVLAQIAAALQLTLLPHGDPREQLIAFLRERALLLVLDNFERVLGASLLLADLLKSAPGIQCLVTSQIALRLRGEQVYSTPPMQTPPARDTAPEALFRFDSVALFVERARAVRAGFRLTADNASTIAEICRQLDGVPLAIELAAAQVAEMSVAEVRDGLESRLDLPWSESPDVPERHRTLRAALDWSYSLLDPAGQQALQQLSVFAGGCFREAVQAVCGAEGLAALRTLHRHSLVNTTESGDGRTRYLLLQMVREYARAKLEEQAEAASAVKERHARYYLQVAEERLARMRSRDEPRALEELGEELDNLRAAMEWARDSRQGELCARLAPALYEPLYRRGFWEEAVAALQAGWDATQGLEEETRRWRAGIRHHRASLALDHGDLAQARSEAEASLALRRELGEAPEIAEALNLLGYVTIAEGNLDAAERCMAEALSLLAAQDHARSGMVLHNLALLGRRRGDDGEARRLYEESLAHYRSAGDLGHEAGTLSNLGVLAQEADDLAEARRLYRGSLALYRKLRDQHLIAVMLNNLGEVAELEGDPETAITLFVHAERIFRELGSAYVTDPVTSLQRLADQLGPERWAQLRAEAEQTAWEDLVEARGG